jgi:hypothetical protein
MGVSEHLEILRCERPFVIQKKFCSRRNLLRGCAELLYTAGMPGRNTQEDA